MSEISGYFIPVSPDENALLKEILVEYGYTPDSNGLKELLFDNLISAKPKNKGRAMIDALGEYIEKNPDTIISGINLIKNAFLKKTKPF